MTPAELDAMREFIVAAANAAVALHPGRDGKDGAPGEKGDPGLDGKDGTPGEKGDPGSAGSDGTNGKRGEKGIDGRDGRDGKDGIASIDDLRAEVAKSVEALVGPTVQNVVAEAIGALPILKYKGVFREGTTYRAGECVTWAGAMWHADSETAEKPGEGQTAWTLAVKRGDRGKDAASTPTNIHGLGKVR